MPRRLIDRGAEQWEVAVSGRRTQYTKDEFGLIFVRGEGDAREVRVTRFSPHGTRSREAALAEMSDERLAELLAQSQPSETSPEAGYRPSRATQSGPVR